MFVVDLVELIADHRLEQMRELNGADPGRLQKGANTLDKGTRVRDLGEDVIAENEIALDARCGQLACHFAAEELHQGRNAPRFGRHGDVGRRIDTKNWDARLYKILQQV